MNTISMPRTLTMATNATWGPLTPPEQSTFYAELVLGNVFETLVDNDSRGNLIPSLAKSWKVSPDLRRYEFLIDTSRRFSNGQNLSARLYKKSLEHSLTVQPASSNASSLDLIYQIEGFEDFEKTGELKGIIAKDDDRLVLQFKNSFRQALFQLTGIRFAAYINDETGGYLGTGPYQIESSERTKVVLVRNSFSSKATPFPKAEVHAVEHGWVDAYCKGLYDVYWLSAGLPYDCQLPRNRSFVLEAGSFMNHMVADVNGTGKRIFSNSKLRRAILYVFWKHVLDSVAAMKKGGVFQNDIQFFQPLQAGRLDSGEVHDLIQAGREWLEELVQESQKTPIHICSADKALLDTIAETLGKAGIGVRPEWMSFSELLSRIYKTMEYDLLLVNAGTGGLDPDDLYHKLGQHGAITSSSIGRPGVWAAFEWGRSLTDPNMIKEVYQEANRAILTEVPSIHIGFLRSGLVYSQDSLVFDAVSLNKERFNLSQFSPRE